MMSSLPTHPTRSQRHCPDDIFNNKILINLILLCTPVVRVCIIILGGRRVEII